ncbi:MAG: Type II secretion system protein F [Elusimicrobia bacterium ADurb.Bin231]|nr:MAG: Type II secretion system protein F [Elusimicrobia bacterium ADurb.Bin231]
MPSFQYKIKLPSGTVNEGVIEADDEAAAVAKLKNQRAIVLEIFPVAKDIFQELKKFNPFKGSVKAKDIVIFSRQLSTLVSAGIPIVQGISVLQAQIENPAFKEVVKNIKENIEAGVSITDSLKNHPKVFSDLYVSMIKAGEVGGILDVILDRVSTYLEESEDLKGKVKSALIYPLIIFIVAIGASVFLLAVVIPKFRDIFTQFGADLPLPTKILIMTSDFLKHNILYLIGGVILFGIAVFQYYKSKHGRRLFDSISLKLPIVGILLTKVSIAKFTRTFSTLVKSGVPILQALDTVAQTAGNKIIEEAIMATKESVKEGDKISEPLKKANIFPPMVVQMIAVGEETGNLEIMLSKIADFYDSEIDSAVKGLTSMIEPLVMLFLGVVVGFMVIAMFMPMFSLGGLASGAG